MAKSAVLRVMISSRCRDNFPAKGGRALSEIRKDLKEEIESLRLFGRQVFEIWINEAQDPQGGKWDSWEVCLQAVRDCDILLVLSNGNAGWAKGGGDVGICHAEMMTGLNQAPGKVRMIDLGKVPIRKTASGRRNKRFQEYIERRNLFQGSASNEAELRGQVHKALTGALISLAQAGVRESSRGNTDYGDAMSWIRMNFEAREQAMRKVLRASILARKGSRRAGDNVVARIGGKPVLLVTHAIPAALTVGPAKEMVGQPFLRDHKFYKALQKERCGGPIHVIACQKAATEAQAIKLLGFPDATVVTTPFGVFVADNIQKVQFAFIVNCHDETTTRHGIQRFFEWLAQSGEDKLAGIRARERTKIVKAIVSASPTRPGRVRKSRAAATPSHTVKPAKKQTARPRNGGWRVRTATHKANTVKKVVRPL
jgi:hypothetical protein